MNVATNRKISAEEYLKDELIDCVVCRSNEGWLRKHYFLGDQFRLESIGLSLPVEEIYHRVDNDDVVTDLQEQ